MQTTIVNPMNEMVVRAAPAPARLQSLANRTVGLLDISKPGGNVFLDRLETILRQRYQVAEVLRVRKPTYTKNAPDQILEQLRGADAVVEALAD